MIMKYNFDKIPNRRGTNSLKWDVDRKELPMWVADMDFETVPEVLACSTHQPVRVRMTSGGRARKSKRV